MSASNRSYILRSFSSSTLTHKTQRVDIERQKLTSIASGSTQNFITFYRTYGQSISECIFYIVPNMQDLFSLCEMRFNRLTLDQLKPNDLRQVFEILMNEPENRTVADLNTLAKILLNLEPVKSVKDFSAVYHLCRSMFLAKFKEKSFIYQKRQDAECLYIILNGRIGLYRRQTGFDDEEDVVFLGEGNAFGWAYNWKQKFLPLSFEQTLLAVLPRRSLESISMRVVRERQEMIRTIKEVKLFEGATQETLFEASQYFSLHRLPYGTHIIKEGEIPKGLYLLLKGTVTKKVQMVKSEKVSSIKASLKVDNYSSGEYFPKENLSECLGFSLVAQSLCQVISIPKQALKLLNYASAEYESQWKTDQYFREQLRAQAGWKQYREKVMMQNTLLKASKPPRMRF